MSPRLRLARFAIALFLPIVSWAGETISRPGVLHLSLDDAIRLALAKNFTIEVSRFQPKIAREEVTARLGRFDPRFFASADATESTQRDDFRTEFDPLRSFVFRSRQHAQNLCQILATLEDQPPLRDHSVKSLLAGQGRILDDPVEWHFAGPAKH